LKKDFESNAVIGKNVFAMDYYWCRVGGKGIVVVRRGRVCRCNRGNHK
jgi:hypothetical protein